MLTFPVNLAIPKMHQARVVAYLTIAMNELHVQQKAESFVNDTKLKVGHRLSYQANGVPSTMDNKKLFVKN